MNWLSETIQEWLLALGLVAMIALGSLVPSRAETPLAQRASELTTAAATSCDDAAAEPVSIRLWQGLRGSLGETFARNVRRFNESQKDVRIEITSHDGYGNIVRAFREAIVAKDPPEIAIVEVRQVGQLASRGEIASFEEFIKNDKTFDRDDLVAPMLLNLKWKGELYGMPLNRSTPVLYLNKQRFEDAGLDVTKPPKTWQEFRDVARKLTTDPQRAYGFTVGTQFSWVFECLVFGAGGRLVDENGQVDIVKFGAEPLQLWSDMIHQDKTARLNALGDFMNGRAAMTIESTALISVFESGVKDFEFATAMLPHSEGQKPGVSTGGGAAVIPASLSPKQRQAAWRFLSWATSTEQTAEWSAMSGYVPARKSAIELLTKAGLYKQHPHYRTAVDQMLVARESPTNPAWAQSGAPITRALQQVLDQNVPAAEALSEAALTIQRNLNATKSAADKKPEPQK